MIASLDHLVLTVTDIMASVAFYRDILGMQALQFEAADGSRRWALAFGAQKINLHPAQAPFTPHAAEPRAGSSDLCFLSPTPLDAWAAYFEALWSRGVRWACAAQRGAWADRLALYP